MKKQLLFTASFCLASLCAIPAVAENTLGVPTASTTFNPVNNTYITNEFCAASETVCACEKASNAGPATPPANGCFQIDLGLGRTRYSSLTKDIVLQLKELKPTARLYSPNGIHVVAGYSVYSIARDKNAGGVPAWVQMVTPSGLLSSFGFTDGESVGKPMGGLADRISERLAMVDAQGWATAADPAFYDYYPGDGSRWRFGASRAAPDYLQIVEHQTPEGRVETRQDLGLEIFCDENGVLRQVVTPAYLADFRVTGQESYELKIYPNEPSCVPGTRAAGGWYDVAAAAVYEAFWTFTNATPSVYGTLDVICRRPGAADQSWRYTYMEALQDFTLRSDQTGLRESLARFTSDDGRSMVLRRVKSDADGKAYSQTELRYESRGGAMELVATVRDPGGLNLAETYGYYTDGAAAGLQRQAVSEDGSWVRYEYDASRRKTAEIRPWLDAPTNAPAEQCAVTRYAYAPFAPGDFLRFNDQRPRTVIGEVCGVEVSRTYHAYPTNAVGQAQEIEERAAFSAAPYGHASSPRTVKTFYAPSAAVPLAGRLATVIYPGGKTETFGYEYGTFNAATFVFAADPDGGAWRETVTTSWPGGQTASESVTEVWDRRAMKVLEYKAVTLPGGDSGVISSVRNFYDGAGHRIRSEYADGRVETASWGSNCCGKESETAADGTVTVYGYNQLKQRVSETRKGFAADGADDVVTLREYDLDGRVLSVAVTNAASGLGYVESRNAYDLGGRLTNAWDRLGNATVKEYATNGTVTVRNPNGAVSVTEAYEDGRTRRLIEDGVVKQSYAYGATPDGMRWTLSAQGPLPGTAPLASVADLRPLASGLDFPWNLNIADPLGRTAFQEKPGFGGTVLVTSNAYDTAGNLLTSVQASCLSNGTQLAVYGSQLYSYAADGSLLFTAMDLNTNGVIDLAGPDRITGSSTVYEKDSSNLWWRVSRSWAYPEFNSSAAITASVQRTQFTGLGTARGDGGVLASHSEALDVRGNATVSEALVDRTARKVTQVTVVPTSVQPSVQISVNGLLQKTVSSTAVTNTFSYDLLGRRMSDTDGRGNTTVTAYSPQGLVAYTEDAATNCTSYAYDTIGRRTEVTDALGNVTHTAYDAEGRVTKTWGAMYPVEYGYDSQGRMVTIKTFREESGPGDETRWLYENATGVLTNKVYADGKGTSYAYTPDGKFAVRAWARGVTTAYSYAPFSGELTLIDYADSTPDITFTYDRPGNMSSVTDASGIHIFSHSPDGQTLVDAVQFENGVFSLHESFDAFGRSFGYALSNTVDGVSSLIAGMGQNYDTFSRISEVSVAGLSGPFCYGWLPGSDLQMSLVMPNGVTRQTTYDPHRDLLASITHTNVAGIALTRRTFSYDVAGRLTARTHYRLGDETNRLDAFGYNPRSELTSAALDTNAYAYSFDQLGNRRIAEEPDFYATCGANDLNQYTNVVYGGNVVFVPAFDLDGNQTLLKTTTGIWHVTYNSENRPVCFSNDATVVEMDYDYMGRRFDYKETANGSDIRHERYLYRMNLQIVALDMFNNANVKHTVAWELGEPVTTRPLVLTVSGSPSPVSYYYCFDQVNNVTEVFDANGALAATYDYAPFGGGTASFGPAAALNPFTFSSEVNDTALGLVYYNYRHLNVLDGRWLSRDPIGEKGSQVLLALAGTKPFPIRQLSDLIALRTEVVQMLAYVRGRGNPERLHAVLARIEGRLLFLRNEIGLYNFVFNSPLNRHDILGLACPCGEALTQIGAVGPVDAATARNLANEALQAAQNSGLPGLHNGQADAFRHCFWSCRMAQEIGADQATQDGNIHEECGNNPPDETAMDLHNNQVGVSLGSTAGADCNTGCMNALNNGTLQPSPGGTPPGDPYDSPYY